MKQLVLLLLATTISGAAWSQMSNLQWQKSLGGSAGDQGNAIQQTSDGGYIINGSSLSTDGQVTGNHGGDDYWVVKLNDTGAIQWEVSLGGTQSEAGNAIAQTLDGGYIVAGGTESMDGDVTCSTTSGADYNYWLVKLTSSGSIAWNNCFGSTNPTEANMARSVALATDSSFIVAGESYANDGEVTGHHGSNAFPDYWVILVSSTGNLLWEKSLGGSASDFAKSVKQTMDGGYIVAGYSNSIDGQVTGNHGDYDYWVTKLDDTGGLQWQKSLGGSGTDDGYAIQQTFDGGYIVVGGSNSTDGQVTGNHGGYDYWVVKLDDTGAIQWEESLGGAGDDVAYTVQQTSDSGYIISGSSDSATGNVTVNYGGQDYWVVKLNKYGSVTWQKSLGGSMNDVSYSIQQTADSGYITVGGSISNDGMVTGNHGGEDYWVAKLSACLLDSPVIIQTDSLLSTSGTYIYYQWTVNGVPIPGATSATYIITANGTYNLTIADTNYCNGISNAIVMAGLGVNNIFNHSVITAMPNPTTGAIHIRGAGIVNISVYNVLGQLMKEAHSTDDISISELPTGMYFLKLSDDHGEVIYQDKIIKQ